MRRFFTLSVSFAVLLAAAAPPAYASGWGAVLRNSVVSDYDDEQLLSILRTIHSALDASGPAGPVEWRDEAGGAGATVIVTGTPKLKGFEDCRRFSVHAYSRKRKGNRAFFTAWRQTPGRWVLVGAS